MKTFGDLLNYCIKITNETKSDVFLEYSGHINYIGLYMYREGWDENRVCFSYYIETNKISNKEEDEIVKEAIKWIDKNKISK